MNAITAWLDNPIFVKHMRSRLRRSQFLPSAVIVLVLCFFIAYGGWALNAFSNGSAFKMLLGLQTILLVIMGATQVASSVGGARESGILDFHRVSPLSPLAVTLGFFFGAPIREYALFALTLPFCLLCIWYESPSIGDFFQAEAVLVLVAWLLQSLSLMAALMTKKPKSGGRGAIGILIFFFVVGSNVYSAASRGPGMGGEITTLGFFGLQLPWLLLLTIFALPALFFFMLASVRKMNSDRAHPYTKREAVICLSVETVLVLGATWDLTNFPPLVFFMIYGLIIIGCVLTATMTPNLGEYAKGVRRAEKRGLVRLSYWDDLALNRVALAAICLVVLVGSTAAWYFIAERSEVPGPNQGFGQRSPVSFRTPIATGVLVVGYFGLALQYFLLKAPRRGTALLGLFLFFVWLVPLVVALFVGLTNGQSQAGQFIASLSPLAGLVISSGVGGADSMFALEAATLGPALAFVFLFNNLVTGAKRRVVQAIHTGPDRAKPGAPIDPLVGDESDLILA